MIILKDKQKLDKFIWRCSSKNPIHDHKINVRSNYIYEGIKQTLPTIYFLTFKYFKAPSYSNSLKSKSYIFRTLIFESNSISSIYFSGK